MTTEVIQNGREYSATNLTINDSKYYAYYIPIKNGNGSVVGMIFACEAIDKFFILCRIKGPFHQHIAIQRIITVIQCIVGGAHTVANINISGIILVDFIDMKNKQNERQLFDLLQRELQL